MDRWGIARDAAESLARALGVGDNFKGDSVQRSLTGLTVLTGHSTDVAWYRDAQSVDDHLELGEALTARCRCPGGLMDRKIVH